MARELFDQAGMPLTLLLVVARQRAKKPVVEIGVTNWVSTELVTQIVPKVSTLTSAICRLRQPVKVQGYESHPEAAKEGDQVLAGDGHKNPKTISIRNVTNACSMAA